MNASLNVSHVNQPSVFDKLNLLKVEENSLTPKYMQIVEIVLSDIENGIFNIGEQIPSINETSTEFYTARNTVEKAYKILKEKGIITSVKGKGYFVSSTGKMCTKRVLMLLSNIDDEKRRIYESFVNMMPQNNEVDLYLYNGQADLLQKCLIKNKGHYDYFVILPELKEDDHGLAKTLEHIGSDKLLVIQNDLSEATKSYNAIVQHGSRDIYNAMCEVQDKLSKYKHLKFIFPDTTYHFDIQAGFVDFCLDNKFKFECKNDLENVEINKGDMFVALEEKHLVSIIKECERQSLKIGKDIGVISYNDSYLKEVLCGGITVFTPDYESMGQHTADFILNRKSGTVDNGFKVICRNSL